MDTLVRRRAAKTPRWGIGMLAGALAALAGCSEGSGSGTGTGGAGGAGGAPCSPDLASIRQTIFEPACALSGCHAGAQPGGDLDLTGDLTAALVNVPSATCPNKTRVVPKDPGASFLMEKLGATPGCGATMPIGEALSAQQIACIEGWIAALDDPGTGGGTPCEMCGTAACVDLQTDNAHCGDCATACPEGKACSGGACQCGEGLAACGALCVDPQIDAAHCGGCDMPCPPGAACSGGACQCGGGLTACGAACVDPQTDTEHCGGCDMPCATGAGCAGGACACPQGQEDCMGACVDTKSNGANCGVCGNMCGVGMVCNNGACTNSCGPLKKCGSSCVDTSTNADHCGGCDMPCPDGASCAASACLCPMGTTVCGGACLDTTSDPTNCGGCGVTCTGGAACENGNCLCPGGGVSCDGACVDTQADPTNCGMCGVACAAGQACTNGACACPGGAVSFAADIQPIFTASCTGMGCHGGAMPAGGLKLSTGNAYAALVNVASSQCPDGRKRVAPSDVANSYLMDKILGVDLCFGTQMPKMGSLPAAQIDKISTWICNGAPNN